jgi:hypothetical protein
MAMTTCDAWHRPMGGTSCTQVRAFRWGDEPSWDKYRQAPDDPTWPCRDCGAEPGGNHHEGCCVAHCRLGCRNPDSPDDPAQAMFCEHAPDDDDDDGDPGDELHVAPPFDRPQVWVTR